MKAVVAGFNQEKALLGAFSVIVQPVVEPMDRFAALPALELVHQLHLVVEDNVEGVVRGILAPLTRVREVRRAAGTKIICADVSNGKYILPSAFRRIRFNLFLRNF